MKQVVAGIILQHNKILICQRTAGQRFPLQWEFPGGKIEPGELPAEALRRELEEELGISATIGEEIAASRHLYGDGTSVELRFFAVRAYSGEMRNLIFEDIRWVERTELGAYKFLEADREIVGRIAAGQLI